MKVIQDTPLIPPALKAELREALDDLARGVRNPDAARKASARMDQMREENRKLLGEQNSAAAIIREMRDSR
jgi:hypothetical protein